MPALVWASISGVATLLAFWILWPRLTVSLSGPLIDPTNVLSVSFDVSNTGNIPLNHATVQMLVSYMSIPTPRNPIIIEGAQGADGVRENGFVFANPTWRDHKIGVDGRLTISPESQLVGRATEADVVIAVSYQPWLFPWKRKAQFRFVALKDGSGRIYWRSWPLDEPPPQN